VIKRRARSNSALLATLIALSAMPAAPWCPVSRALAQPRPAATQPGATGRESGVDPLRCASGPAPGEPAASFQAACANAAGTLERPPIGDPPTDEGLAEVVEQWRRSIRGENAVQASRQQPPPPEELAASPGIAIPDNDPSGVTSELRFTQPGEVATVSVRVDVRHPYRGDLRIELEHDGRTVTLFDREGGQQDDVVAQFSPAGFVGAEAAGVWRLRVRDVSGADTGHLRSWRMSITRCVVDCRRPTAAEAEGEATRPTWRLPRHLMDVVTPPERERDVGFTLDFGSRTGGVVSEDGLVASPMWAAAPIGTRFQPVTYTWVRAGVLFKNWELTAMLDLRFSWSDELDSFCEGHPSGRCRTSNVEPRILVGTGYWVAVPQSLINFGFRLAAGTDVVVGRHPRTISPNGDSFVDPAVIPTLHGWFGVQFFGFTLGPFIDVSIDAALGDLAGRVRDPYVVVGGAATVEISELHYLW
jgi:subtilisin-like proprotein convertase family protein